MTSPAGKCVHYHLLSVLFLVPAAYPHPLAAGESEEAGHGHSHHHLEATFGAAYTDGKSGVFTGFEYEYRFSDLVGVGAFVDGIFDGFDLAAVGIVANFHPAGRWKVLTGLGVEHKIGDALKPFVVVRTWHQNQSLARQRKISRLLVTNIGDFTIYGVF